jgi:hypothetical protein
MLVLRDFVNNLFLVKAGEVFSEVGRRESRKKVHPGIQTGLVAAAVAQEPKVGESLL